MRLARADPRVIRLRDLMLAAVRRVFETWSTDASVSDVRLPINAARLLLKPVSDYERFCQGCHVLAVRRYYHLLAGSTPARARLCCSSATTHCHMVVIGQCLACPAGSAATLSHDDNNSCQRRRSACRFRGASFSPRDMLELFRPARRDAECQFALCL
jgi:hypothetical protein